MLNEYIKLVRNVVKQFVFEYINENNRRKL